LRALNQGHVREFKEAGKRHGVPVNTNKKVGVKDHLKVFADPKGAKTWFQQSEGVAPI
jgi:hypothetical protein